MKITVELLPARRETTMDLSPGSNGLDLTKLLGIAPDVHILVRNDLPIPIDEELHDNDVIRIISVVSGG